MIARSAFNDDSIVSIPITPPMKSHSPYLKSSRAFTLIELISGIAVIAILLLILVSAVNGVIQRRDATVCLANLRQIGQATMLYTTENEGKYPPLQAYFSDSQAMEFWYTELRLFLGATDKKLARPNPNASGRNLPVFYCPSVNPDEAYPHTHYAGSTHVFLPPPAADQTKQSHVADLQKPSQMILVSEIRNPGQPRYIESNWQLVPSQIRSDPSAYFPQNRHHGYVNVVFVDGHTEQIPVSKLETREDVEKYYGKGSL